MSSDITPEIAERVKAEVLTMQTLDDLWVLATDYAELLDRAERAEAQRDAAFAAGQDETMAWAVLGEDGKMIAINYDRMTAQHLCNPGERIVRVAIRVVEGGDDAA